MAAAWQGGSPGISVSWLKFLESDILKSVHFFGEVRMAPVTALESGFLVYKLMSTDESVSVAARTPEPATAVETVVKGEREFSHQCGGLACCFY